MGTVLKWGFVAVLFVGNIIGRSYRHPRLCESRRRDNMPKKSGYAAAESAEKL